MSQVLRREPGLEGIAWHSHEMIFGFTVAILAGFLLTAVENWTDRKTARGGLLIALVVLGVLFWPLSQSAASNEAEAAIGTVLDTFHRAASEADGKLYFSLFSDDAVFIGTDVTERWSIDQFKVFAEPYFSQGHGWTYVPGERHVTILPGGVIARFDEILSNESYGTCRGTGVLILTSAGWRISQYSLTIPIPNELARDFVGLIKELEAQQGKGAENPAEPSVQ